MRELGTRWAPIASLALIFRIKCRWQQANTLSVFPESCFNAARQPQLAYQRPQPTSSSCALAQDLEGRKGRSILHNPSDGEVAELVAYKAPA